ncbi:DotD/TraH family lipoprotein [Piscirickettsia litoralis]|uniref:Uncharacterized protein n=1 Tax=Piscirickettsia litoralis TaxID=1891921 RepID=A0ABX3A4S8_9GAMM|nr:DotD/TraH family lipoprotein [Piscirickettsia litoralis]ODN43862.1 hypothetical protein BGC07_14405 [Piscirickettsia litoralis]
MKVIFITIFLTLTAILQGCSSQPTKIYQQEIANEQLKNNIKVQQALIKAVEKTSQSLISLSKIRRAQYPKQLMMPFINIHDQNLNKNLSISWYGPINAVVRNIARAVGFKYQQFGKKPGLPVLVDLNYQSTPALVIFQNIELQANNKAAIKIFPKEKIVSLRYLNND